MFYSGTDPVTLLDDLRELGQAHITARADQVPPLASLEAEHCYLWWEILLVTNRDQAAIKDVFVFVEDECDVRIRLLEDQGGTVALLGSVPADAFELFKAECEEHLERMEGDALALEEHPERQGQPRFPFSGRSQHQGQCGSAVGTRHWRRPYRQSSAATTGARGPRPGVPSRSVPWSERRSGVGTDDPNRAGGLRRDPHSVGEPHAQRRGRTGLAGTARAFGRADLHRAEHPARGWARSRVSQYGVTVRRDD